jgi:hypothetical protein
VESLVLLFSVEKMYFTFTNDVVEMDYSVDEAKQATKQEVVENLMFGI